MADAVDAVHENLPFVGKAQALDHLHRRRLAGPVGAPKGRTPPLPPPRKLTPLTTGFPPVTLDQAADPNIGRFRSRIHWFPLPPGDWLHPVYTVRRKKRTGLYLPGENPVLSQAKTKRKKISAITQIRSTPRAATSKGPGRTLLALDACPPVVAFHHFCHKNRQNPNVLSSPFFHPIKVDNGY